jgi:hypothetical protein
MSYNIIYENGGVKSVAVAALDKIVVKTSGKCEVYQVVGYPQFPESRTLLSELSNGTYTSSAFAAAATIEINNLGASEVHYAAGTDAVLMDGTADLIQGTAGVLNATGSVTAAMLLAGVLTSTTAAAVAGTVITGTVLDAAADFAIGDSKDLSILSTGGNTFTLTANTGITLVGVGTVVTTAAVLFRILKTAANTFTITRIAG